MSMQSIHSTRSSCALGYVTLAFFFLLLTTIHVVWHLFLSPCRVLLATPTTLPDKTLSFPRQQTASARRFLLSGRPFMWQLRDWSVWAWHGHVEHAYAQGLLSAMLYIVLPRAFKWIPVPRFGFLSCIEA
jgi:hypothetical protein